MMKKKEYKKPETMWNPSFFMLIAAAFFYFINMMMLNPLYAGYAGKIGASGAVMGISSGIAYFAAVLASPFTGPLVDRTNKRLLSLLSLFFLFLSTIGYVFSKNVSAYLFFRVMHGLSFAVVSTVFSTSIAAFVPDKEIGKAMGFYSMMQALAMSIAPAIAISIKAAYDYYHAFFACAMCALLAFILAFFIEDLNSGFEKPKEPFTLKVSNILSPQAAPYALVVLFTGMIYSAVSGFLITFTDHRGMTEGVSMFFTVYAVTLLGSRLFTMRLMDRLSYGAALLVGCPCLIACCLCIQFAPNRWVLWLGAACMALGHGTLQTMSQVFSVKSVPLSQRGVANSTYYIGLNTGLAFGPMVAGAVVQGGLLQNMFLIYLVLAAMPMLLLLIYRKRYFTKS